MDTANFAESGVLPQPPWREHGTNDHPNAEEVSGYLGEDKFRPPLEIVEICFALAVHFRPSFRWGPLNVVLSPAHLLA